MWYKKITKSIKKVLFPKPQPPLHKPILRPPGLIELSSEEEKEHKVPQLHR